MQFFQQLLICDTVAGISVRVEQAGKSLVLDTLAARPNDAHKRLLAALKTLVS